MVRGNTVMHRVIHFYYTGLVHVYTIQYSVLVFEVPVDCNLQKNLLVYILLW